MYACQWCKMGQNKSNSSCRHINTTYYKLKLFPLIYEYTQQIMTHFSISRAATFLFSYSLSLRALTMFGVNGEKSFSVFIFSKYLWTPPLKLRINHNYELLKLISELSPVNKEKVSLDDSSVSVWLNTCINVSCERFCSSRTCIVYRQDDVLKCVSAPDSHHF